MLRTDTGPVRSGQCFKALVAPSNSTLFLCDYQVITGGHYDVDCYVEDPAGNVIYRETKKQYDSFTYRTEVKGVYRFCFSNEFSTFSHKTVYFDFQVGDEPPILPDMATRVTALTQVSGRDRTSGPAPPALSMCLLFCPCLSLTFSSKRLHLLSGLLVTARALSYQRLFLSTLPTVFLWHSTSFRMMPCACQLCDMLRW